MPWSIKHLIDVKHKLKSTSYAQLIHDHEISSSNNDSLIAIIKSYFWACRIIPNCKCLPRSIAIYQKLKSLGYDVEHKFGVYNQEPNNLLKAHAWVELDGQALNESKNLNNFIELKKSNGIK